jgi:phenylalanyl-tRNA synthetase beta chain
MQFSRQTAAITARCCRSKITTAGKPPKPTKPFKFDLALVKRITGLDLGAGEIKRLLAALGVTLDGKGKHLSAAPPSWRPDITAPADLVEEVVRLTGVDKVPATPMRREAGVARPVLTEAQRRQWLTRRLLASRGLVEAGPGRSFRPSMRSCSVAALRRSP